jgi:hypothetical protein
MQNLRHYLQWYYFTRATGAIAAFYELFRDHSPERGTIILAAFGLMGFDLVSRKKFGDDREKKHANE